MVDGNVEETLNLSGVQVPAMTRSAPGPSDQIGDKFGGDRHPADVLAVLPGVAVIRQHGRDSRGTGPLEAVDHDQQFHQRFIDRRQGRLDDEHVPAANVLIDADRIFAVWKILEFDLAERVAEAMGNSLGEGKIGAAA